MSAKEESAITETSRPESLVQDNDNHCAEKGGVEAKYRGTAADKRDMVTLGRTQVLRRNFKFVSMLGFASTVMAAWEICLVLSTYVLIDGGTADMFWGFLVLGMGMGLVYASLAELASMSPTAGGQYHCSIHNVLGRPLDLGISPSQATYALWNTASVLIVASPLGWVSEFGPPGIQKLLSYTVGWLCAIGWQVYLAGVCFMVGSIIQGLIALNVQDYVWQNFHGTLLTIAIILFSIVFNTSLATRLPQIELIMLILHFAGFFAIIIPLWVMAPKSTVHDAILVFSNNGGWPSDGLSAMIGLISLNVMIGYDCSVHMSEEIVDASITLPRAIMWSYGPNAALNFIMVVTLVFTVGNVDEILATTTRQPFIQVFYNATRSYAATNVMVAIVVIILTSCCISEVATSSRQLWSFARDRGVPFSGWLSHVSPGWNVPIRAVFVSLVVSSLLACINIGSSTALNAINSLGGVAILCSYFITIGCVVWRRLYGAPLPIRRWSLGRYGLTINIAAMLFLIPIWFFAFWPLGTPVTASTMNWSSAMFGGVLSLAMMYYVFKGRHEYSGPVTQVKREQ